MMLPLSVAFYLSVIAAISAVFVHIRLVRARNGVRRAELWSALGTKKDKIVGFFHPYCNAGGGGERVLWTAIKALQLSDRDVVSVVYSGDVDATKEEILAKVKARFAIELDPKAVHFVFLRFRYLVEDSTWPRFTLLGQSIGSMYLAWEAMSKLIPDLYIDTMGYAFTFHVVSWLGGIPVGAYVHYPTISTDMLERVRSRKSGVTNSDAISSSSVLSSGKLLYYRFFMYYYSLSLHRASFLMVNSSWTKNHVDAILQRTDNTMDRVHLIFPLFIVRYFLLVKQTLRRAEIVYPPCDTGDLAKFSLEGREKIVLSIAQFRPEKDHVAQIHAFSTLLQMYPQYKNEARLVLLGGSRNGGDAARVEGLRGLAKTLGIESQTEFIINASYPDMLNWLSRSSVGLSTMVDEHFGINVVEYMAAGVIPVTHASGGPLNDIVVPFDGKPTGYHATTTESYAKAFHKVLSMSSADELGMRTRARKWAVQKFSEEEFEAGWNKSGWRSWLDRTEKKSV